MERYRPDITDPKVLELLNDIKKEFGGDYLKNAVQMGLRRSLPDVISFLRGEAHPVKSTPVIPAPQPMFQEEAPDPLKGLRAIADMTDEDFK